MHTKKQPKKVHEIFISNSRIFFNRYLTESNFIFTINSPNTYLCSPNFVEMNAPSMEEFRVLEHKCLRACVSLFRVSLPDSKKYVGNKILYETVNIPRIDWFLIKMTRDYFSKLTTHTNVIIKNIASLNVNDIQQQLESVYILPQICTRLDTLGLIQNHDNIPLLYHWKCNKAIKRVTIRSDDFLLIILIFSNIQQSSQISIFTSSIVLKQQILVALIREPYYEVTRTWKKRDSRSIN